MFFSKQLENCDPKFKYYSSNIKISTGHYVNLKLVVHSDPQNLPYNTTTDIVAPDYMSINGSCSIPQLPYEMPRYISFFLRSRINKSFVVMEQQESVHAPNRVHHPSTSAPYQTALTGSSCPVESLSDDILLKILSHLNSKTLLKSVSW